MDKHRLKHYAEKVKLESTGLDRRIVARVAGVTFEGRQDVVSEVGEETPVKLVRDRRNEHDFYAVEVHVKLGGKWKQAGFIPNPMCRLVSRSLDNGVKLQASVHRRTGGMVSDFTGEPLNYGLEINVVPER